MEDIDWLSWPFALLEQLCLFCKDDHWGNSLCCKGDLCPYSLVCGSHAPLCSPVYLPSLLVASLAMTWDAGPAGTVSCKDSMLMLSGFMSLYQTSLWHCWWQPVVCLPADSSPEGMSLGTRLSFMPKTWPSPHGLSVANTLRRQYDLVGVLHVGGRESLSPVWHMWSESHSHTVVCTQIKQTLYTAILVFTGFSMDHSIICPAETGKK